jgi:NDP-sugar pyrophosphorylase family protein
MIPALVLTAGFATRLRPLSLVRAKAALPVAGATLIERILRRLHAAGVADAVLNLHHLPETITRVVGDGHHLRIRARYSWETPILGSAGGPRRAVPIIGGSPFLIVNGDTLTDVDLHAFVHEHRRTGALVSMAVIPNREPAKYGGVLAGHDRVVTGFSRPGSAEHSFHFVGLQVVEASAFDAVPPDVPYESVNALYPALIAERPGSVRVVAFDATFNDIGTPRDYVATSWALGQAAAARPGAGSHVSPHAIVEHSLIWDDVVIEDGAQLHGCVVTDGVRVPAGTTWRDQILRRADGQLLPGEHLTGGLAVSPLS